MQAATAVQKKCTKPATIRRAAKSTNPPVIQPAQAKLHPVYGTAANLKGFSLSKQDLPLLNHWHKRAVDGALSFGDSRLTKSQEELFDLYDHAAWDIHIAAEKLEARNSRDVWHKVDLLARQSRYLGADDCNVSASVMTSIADELRRFTSDQPEAMWLIGDDALWKLHDEFCREYEDEKAFYTPEAQAGSRKNATAAQKRASRTWMRQVDRTTAAANRVMSAPATTIFGMLMKLHIAGYIIGTTAGTFSVPYRGFDANLEPQQWRVPFKPRTPELSLILSLRDDLQRLFRKGVA